MCCTLLPTGLFVSPSPRRGGGVSSPAGCQPAARWLGSLIKRSLRKTLLQIQRNLNEATCSPFGCHASGFFYRGQVRRRIDVFGQGIQSIYPSDKIFTHFSDLETALAHTGQTYLHSGQSHFTYREGKKQFVVKISLAKIRTKSGSIFLTPS